MKLSVMSLIATLAVLSADSTTADIPTGLQKLFDETTLPCTPRAVTNHPCYFCKCNVHGTRQHCIYTCDPTSGNPLLPGTKMCTATDHFELGCHRCRCSKGQLFYECNLTLYCAGSGAVSEGEEGNDF
uniref:(northern house mosquito) hypothetical protein n=1 Tax=Culex pipiens TaxID=7175 RepID=A0A8D8N969_CULPI